MKTPSDPKTAGAQPGPCSVSRLRFVAAFAATALAAAAQTASTPPPATPPAGTDQPVTMEEYVVQGYSQSLQTSLNAKRSSEDDVQVITSDDTGKFPDINLAESLSHLPGVTVDRLFGEGERVSINGTDPNLNRVLLNGEPISSADWYVLDTQTRQFDYLLLAPDVIGQATVYLTSEAKLLEGSIGGTVVVNTRDPLALPAVTFQGNLGDGYNDRSKKNEGSESAMLSWHNDSKTFGILIGGEDQRDLLRRDGVESLGLKNQTNLAVAGPGTIPGLPANFITDEVVNTAFFLQNRHRQGGNAAITYRPTDRLSIELTGLYVKQTMDNVNLSWYIYPGDNWSGLPHVTNATTSNGVLNNYTINSAPLVVDAFNRAAQIITQDYNAKIIYKADDYTLTGNIGYTRATGGTQHQFFAENFVFANANVSESATQASFTTTGVVGGDPTASNLNNGGDFSTAGAGNFYGNIASNPEVDDEKWYQLDLDIPLKGMLKTVSAGFRYSDHKGGQTGNVVSVPNAGGVSTNLSGLGFTAAPSNYLSGLPGVTPSMSDHVILPSYGSIANFVANLPATGLAGATSGESLLNYFNSQPGSSAAVFTATPTFTIDEQIVAAYAEGTFSAGQLSGNFGARFVDTTTTSASYDLSTPGAPTLISQKDSYTNVLPSVNLVYDLTPNQPQDQLVRFSVSQVIARPNTSAEANWVQLYDSSLSGVGGNTALKPYESVNTDLDYEFYFAKNSYFAIDGFYKDISNYIINGTTVEQWKDYSLPGTPLEGYEITRPGNGGAATSEGASVSLQYETPVGLGIQTNYTRLHTTSSNGELPFSSKDQITFSPFFENRWGLVRLTYSWRDDYVSSSFNGTTLVTTAPFTELDANLSVNLGKHMSLVFSARNLLDETYRQYYQTPGAPNLFADAYKFGRTYSASVHWNF
jgi:iron complex outermembrane receptor protein